MKLVLVVIVCVLLAGGAFALASSGIQALQSRAAAIEAAGQ